MEGYETRETQTLSESIYSKQVRLIALLQESPYAGEDFQMWRSALVDVCHGRAAALSTDLVEVRLRLQYVEKYREKSAFTHLSEGDKSELIQQIAPIVRSDDNDECAKRFDNFMYGLMLSSMEKTPSFRHAQKQLCKTASALERKVSIPQVKAKLDVIREINTDDFWTADDVLLFEKVRQELRELIKFLDKPDREPIVTRLTDPVTETQEGVPIDAPYDFEDYRDKVNRYISEHGTSTAIYKLTHNIPLSSGDYDELERVLTSELGSREDYLREYGDTPFGLLVRKIAKLDHDAAMQYGDTPFGLLVRKIAKLDHDAAMQAFSAFINDASLNQRQIEFVLKVIHHVEQNGYMESTSELVKPPFCSPPSTRCATTPW